MPLRLIAGLFALLELSNAYVQLEFQKQRVALSQLHPTIRQRHLHQKRAGIVDADLENAQNNLLYLVNITVGSDKQEMSLQLDTGSSDIWVPYIDSDVCKSSYHLCSNGAYSPGTSNTFRLIAAQDFDISYVDGSSVSGDYFDDTFTIGGASIYKQLMGLARDAQIQSNYTPFQGIMGVGFPSGETWAAQGGEEYPNIITTLKSQGHTSTMAYSLWLNDLDASTGSILFGGVDRSRYSGDLTVLPIQPDADSGDLTSFTVVLDGLNVKSGGGKIQYSRSNAAIPVILDSGTTLTYLPDEIAREIATGVGAGYDNSGGLYVPCDLMNSPATFNFVFGNSKGPTIQIDISEFVIPYPPQPNGKTMKLEDGTPICQWGILNAGNAPNLFGDTFLRSAYVVYDVQNENIAIAQTRFNVSDSDSNIEDITNKQLPGASSTASGAQVTQTFSGSPNQPTNGNVGTQTIPLTGPSATFDVSGTKTATPKGSDSRSGRAAVDVSVHSIMALVVLVSGFSGALVVPW